MIGQAMVNAVVPTIYVTFVDRLGLKSLFPAFMKTPSGKIKKTLQLEGKAMKQVLEVFEPEEFEEQACGIVAALLTHLEEGEHQNRILRKFLEKDYQKIERPVT